MIEHKINKSLADLEAELSRLSKATDYIDKAGEDILAVQEQVSTVLKALNSVQSSYAKSSGKIARTCGEYVEALRVGLDERTQKAVTQLEEISTSIESKSAVWLSETTQITEGLQQVTESMRSIVENLESLNLSRQFSEFEARQNASNVSLSSNLGSISKSLENTEIILIKRIDDKASEFDRRSERLFAGLSKSWDARHDNLTSLIHDQALKYETTLDESLGDIEGVLTRRIDDQASKFDRKSEELLADLGKSWDARHDSLVSSITEQTLKYEKELKSTRACLFVGLLIVILLKVFFLSR